MLQSRQVSHISGNTTGRVVIILANEKEADKVVYNWPDFSLRDHEFALERTSSVESFMILLYPVWHISPVYESVNDEQ